MGSASIIPNIPLVFLSYVIAVFGSYTALQLAIAIPQAQSRSVLAWVLAAAVALGGGAIWSMHFIGMIAVDFGMPVSYDRVLTFMSLGIAIGASALGLYVVGRGQSSTFKLLLGGLITGLGVAWMHYTGMEAMIMPMIVTYDPKLFALSIVIAVAAATVALWLAFNLRGDLQRFGSAFVMGIAVCGMHYTGIYAMRMTHAGAPVANTDVALSTSSLAYSIFGIAALLLTLLLLLSGWRTRRTLAFNL